MNTTSDDSKTSPTRRRAPASGASTGKVTVPRASSASRKTASASPAEPAKPARRSAAAAKPATKPASALASTRKSTTAKTGAAKPSAVKSSSARTRAAKPGTVKSSAPKSAPRKKAQADLDVRVRDAVVARLDAMKAVDLKLIDVRDKTSVTDFLVIASGTSTRHVKAMGDEVVVAAKNLGTPPIGIEGEKDAEWILVDLGDTVVHVMLPRTRDFYGLERLWSVAEEHRAAAL